MYNLTAKDKAMLMNKLRVNYTVVLDCDAKLENTGYRQSPGSEPTRTYTRYSFNPTRMYTRCSCVDGRNEKQNNKVACEFCGTKALKYLYTQNMQEKIATVVKDRTISAFYPCTTKLAPFLYVKQHPDYEQGILVFKVSINIDTSLADIQNEEAVWAVQHIVEIVPGEFYKAYKVGKKKNTPINMQDALQISSKLIKNNYPVFYEDSLNSVDFVLKHPKFAQYTAYMQLFNMVEQPISKNAFFLIYMYLYSSYDCVERIIKMEYTELIAKILVRIADSRNKTIMKSEIDSLMKLFDNEQTEGKRNLLLPSYIIEHQLAVKNLEYSLDLLIRWCDVYQLSHGTLTKEEYQNTLYELATTFEVQNANPRVLLDIMPYGYSINEIITYAKKSAEKTNLSPSRVISTWRDYLNMCYTMNVQWEKFPQDISAAHDHIIDAFNIHRTEVKNVVIDRIARVAEKYIPCDKDAQNSKYMICLPHSVADIVQEGQNQHNCVGSYEKAIQTRSSLVFFIREKNNPTRSFVTAEYRDGCIAQLYYRHNRSVSDPAIRELARSFCRNLNNVNFSQQKI